jgi:hypothetical protein
MLKVYPFGHPLDDECPLKIVRVGAVSLHGRNRGYKLG